MITPNWDMPAFPRPTTNFRDPNGQSMVGHGSTGVTKRELFAAMAMQGICSSTPTELHLRPACNFIAEAAVQTADALLAALKKGASPCPPTT